MTSTVLNLQWIIIFCTPRLKMIRCSYRNFLLQRDNCTHNFRSIMQFLWFQGCMDQSCFVSTSPLFQSLCLRYIGLKPCPTGGYEFRAGHSTKFPKIQQQVSWQSGMCMLCDGGCPAGCFGRDKDLSWMYLKCFERSGKSLADYLQFLSRNPRGGLTKSHNVCGFPHESTNSINSWEK